MSQPDAHAQPDPSPAPAASAALPGTPDAEGWRRMHPLSPLLRGGLALLVIAGIVIANFRDRLVELFFAGDLLDSEAASSAVDEADLITFIMERGLLVVVLGGALVLILLIVGISWLMWRFATYRITDEAVETRSGIVFRNHRRAPLERIQSVNLQRPMLARALGLTKIQIVTAGQGGTVELAYLGHQDAKTVREQILRRAAEKRNGPGAGVAPLAEIQGGAAVGLDGAVLQAADGLVGRAQDFIDTDVDAEALASQSLVKVPVGRLLGSIALSWEAVSLVLVVLAVVIGGAILSPYLIFGIIPMIIVMAGVMLGQFNKGFNFTLSRGRDTVRTGAGLTSTMTETIPFGRIHAIEARQPLFWRPLGWWKVRITTAGHSIAQGGQNSSQNVVLPVGVEADVLRVLDTLLPGIGDDEAEIAALRDGLSGPAHGYLGAGPRAGWVLWWGRARAGIAIEGLGSEDATLRIRRGVLTRSLSIMPIVRAQSVQLRRPLVHRALDLASIQAHTVLGPVRMEVRGLGLGDAQRTFDALAAAVLRIQGAEAQRIARAHAEGREPEPPVPPGPSGTSPSEPAAAAEQP
ncbi:PH domain-containing protein [Leucobacter chromiireducens]